MRKIIITTVCLLASLVLTSCVLNFDVDPSDVDMAITMVRDDSCTDINEYMIAAQKPYDKNYAAAFVTDEVEQQWVGVPDLDFDLAISLMEISTSSQKTHKYNVTDFSKSWGKVAVFTTVCDEGYDKPALLLDLAQFVLMINTTSECNWFNKVELFEETGINQQTKQALLQRLGEGNLNGLRMAYQWHEALAADSVVHVNLTDINGKTYKFRFPVKAAYGQRLDFDISCNADTLEVGMMMKSQDGTTYKPVPIGEDVDGDTDTEIDGDIEEDGDIDGDTDGDVDGDVDGDIDGDTEEDIDLEEDGDIDTIDQVEEELEPEAEEEIDEDLGCGTVEPTSFFEWEAEELVWVSNPDGLGEEFSCATADGDEETESCVNPFRGTGAVILNGTDIDQELVFTVNVQDSWKYTIQVAFAGGQTGWGKVSLFIDDATEPVLFHVSDKPDMNLSLVGTDLGVFSEVDFKDICLLEGEHQFRFRVTSTNSTGHKIGVDYFRILPY